jgi:hypothetical protein
MKSLDERIAELDAILDSGVSSMTVDGETTAIDLAAVRKRRDELMAEKAGNRRPTMVALDLSRAFG